MVILPLAIFAAHIQSSWEKNWSTVRSAIESRYYARESNKKFMTDLLNKYEPKARAATSEEGFEAAVNAMIDDFKDSHFDLFTKSDQGFYMMDSLSRGDKGDLMPSIGAWFDPKPEGLVVQMLIEGGEAANAGLRKGDVVLTVNGQPARPILSFNNHKGETVKLGYKRGTATLSADVKVVEQNGTDFFLDGTKNSSRIIEAGGKKYGYIHLWTMSNEAQKSALAGAVYGKFKDTDGMILDIRDGFGGRPEGFGDPFFRPEVKLDWVMPEFTNHQLFGYGKPLVVLINKGSRSAKEVFAFIMKKSGRATLVGEKTGGNVLGTTPMRLDNWGYLEIPAVDVLTDGTRLEKVGVSPDITVASEFDSSGKDLYIETALKALSGKVSGTK